MSRSRKAPPILELKKSWEEVISSELSSWDLLWFPKSWDHRRGYLVESGTLNGKGSSAGATTMKEKDFEPFLEKHVVADSCLLWQKG